MKKIPINFFRKLASTWTIASILSMIGAGIGMPVIADDATPVTSVNVGNDAPTFNVGFEPHEDATSDNTTPTNMDANVTFKATASDGNGNQWYLAICKSNAIATSTDDAPTCPGGAWVISTATNSNTEATVNYTITSGETLQSYNWYGFACDKTSGSPQCSAMSNSGTAGNNGSPFAVNHRPTFTAVSDEAGNPGAADLTITATTYNDTDNAGTQDTVSMYVCKSNDFTGTVCGAGGTWCSVTGITPTNALACDLTVPDPQAHGEVNYYPYLIDSHSLAASGGKHASAETYTVNDVLPTISGTPELNGADPTMDLTAELSTTAIFVTGIVTDSNGCADITASTTADVWLTSVGHTACNTTGEANNNNCYPRLVCAYDSGVETCGANDKTGGYKCTVAFQYYANPTDASTPWSTDSWTASLVPADGQGINEGGSGNSATTTMNSFLALGLATSYDAIAYGNVSAGNNTDPLLERTRVEATGNVSLDVNLSGTTMTGPGTAIPIANQRYGLGDTAPAWSAGTALSGAPTLTQLNTCKSGYTAAPEWKRVWWGIEIPAGQVAGAYTGTNTITAVKNNWAGADDWCEVP